MIKKIMLFLSFLSINTVYAQSNEPPTVIEAVAATPDGGKNISIVTQPADSPNPLGNPIVGPSVPPQAYNAADNTNCNNTYQTANQPDTNDSLPQQSLELGKQFKNTLLEANGEIYDIQSYPAQDINVIEDKTNPQTIYSPDVNN